MMTLLLTPMGGPGPMAASGAPMQATAQHQTSRAHRADFTVVRVHELLVRPAKAGQKLLELNKGERARQVRGVEDPASADQAVV